jgi:hypothetical protein
MGAKRFGELVGCVGSVQGRTACRGLPWTAPAAVATGIIASVLLGN